MSKEIEEIPSWLNEEFLVKALKSGDSAEDVEVNSYNIKRATAPGDNYLSQIFRATVQVTKDGHAEERSLIIKSQPEGEFLKKVTKNYKLFELEEKMLKDVVPAIHEILRKLEPENSSLFSAKFIYSHLEPPTQVIVLEDLKESGFVMAERTAGLDHTHCMMVMRKIAQFHAASLVLREERPDLLEPFVDPPSEYMLLMEFSDFLEKFMKDMCDEIDNKYEELKQFTGRIRKISENAVLRMVEGRKRKENEFNVLAHGDLWVNNIMFHYTKDGHQLTDMRLVDYQLSLWTSPAVDLLYFLNSSPSNNLLKDQTIFIEEYHKIFGETLFTLGYQHLHITLEHLNELLENRAFFGMLSVFSIRNVAMVDEENLFDIETISTTEDQSFKFGKMYIESLKIQIPLLDGRGLLA